MYFALWDTQLGQRMHSGRNCESLKELRDALLGYFDSDHSIDDMRLMNRMSIEELANYGNFIIECSKELFEDNTVLQVVPLEELFKYKFKNLVSDISGIEGRNDSLTDDQILELVGEVLEEFHQ